MLKFIIVLSVVQGLTEFLPVSSSGHLALLQLIWRVALPGLLFDALVHVGTLLSVLWVFRRRWWLILKSPLVRDENLHFLSLIIIGMMPTVLLGVFLDPWIERAFDSILVVGVNLLVTGGLLFLAERPRRGGRGLGEMTIWDALLVGTMQGIAILPGISRSGFTIGIGLLLGLERGLAAEFSFLLATPTILGAAALKGVEALRNPEAHSGLIGFYLLGTVLAAAVGVLAIRYLLRVLRRGRLDPFAYYCWAAGTAAIGLALALGR